ncbi:hypothetical protein B0H17DRAFT_1302193, partial [Mycena rosella]
REEAGITAPLQHAGTLLFVVPGSKWAHVDIFRAEEYSGTNAALLLYRSNEMCQEWFNKGEIPFDNKWDTDQYWLPLLLLAKRPFSGRADYEKKERISF